MPKSKKELKKEIIELKKELQGHSTFDRTINLLNALIQAFIAGLMLYMFLHTK